MVSFTIGKGNPNDIFQMTKILGCIGYAEEPWCYDGVSIICAKDGKNYIHGFKADWDKKMPCLSDVVDNEKFYDCFINITDKTSGLSFQSGQGCVDSDTRQFIQNFIDKHHSKKMSRS